MLYDSKELVMENNPSLEHIKERDYDMVSAQFFLPNSRTSQDFTGYFFVFYRKSNRNKGNFQEICGQIFTSIKTSTAAVDSQHLKVKVVD